MPVFELRSSNSAFERAVRAIERSSESTSRSDLGLLAWLATTSGAEQPPTDWMSLTDDDLAASDLSDESEMVDVAFELLEGNALASTAI
jgi:hypothetical protein